MRDLVTVRWDEGGGNYVARLNGDFLARGMCLSDVLLRASVRCERLEDEAGTEAVIEMSVAEELADEKP